MGAWREHIPRRYVAQASKNPRPRAPRTPPMMVLLSDELKTRAPHVGGAGASQCRGTKARLPFLGAGPPSHEDVLRASSCAG